jgi:large subunit ribosomal protein L18
MNKREARIRRATRTRAKIRSLEATRLCINKTGQHIYAQVTTPTGDKTLVSASTLDKEIKDALKATSNKDAAKAVGSLIAKRALAAGITAVAFDRSGFSYHGRVKALADAARETGLEF